MKKISLLIVLLIKISQFYSQNCSYATVVLTENGVCEPDAGWTLLFEDEFDQLNKDCWQSAGGSTNLNRNLEYNQIQNCQTNNSVLSIIAKIETVTKRAIDYLPDNQIMEVADGGDGGQNLRTYNFTSGQISTKKAFDYGYFEIKCKIPKGRGMWPAFWLYGGDVWNEIDIFEFMDENNDNDLSKIHHMNEHYKFDPNSNEISCTSNYKGVDFSQDFHVFGLYWDNYKTIWYVDGNQVRQSTKFSLINGQQVDCNSIIAYNSYLLAKNYPHTESQNVILNIAVQSGNPDLSIFPAELQVDYFRYWQNIPDKCSDKSFNSNSQANFEINNYNFLLGNDIKFYDNISYGEDYYIDVKAVTEINFQPGVEMVGSNKNFTIESLCSSRLSNNLPDFNLKDNYDLANIDDSQDLSKRILDKVIVSPNPFKDEININLPNDLSSPINITVKNTIGEEVKNINIETNYRNSPITINLSDLSPSIYYLIIQDKNGKMYFEQIVKQ